MSGSRTQVEIMVPEKAVGLVIGKKGAMIQNIQEESGAQIHMIKDRDSSQERSVCTITGHLEQVEAARILIDKLVLRKSPDAVQIHYAVPSDKCGAIVGKGGKNITKIKKISGAYVYCTFWPSSTSLQKGMFIISGAPSQVQHAQRLVDKCIGEKGTVVLQKNDDEIHRCYLSKGMVKKIPIPHSVVKLMMDKSNDLIKSIELDTGVCLQLLNRKKENPDGMVCVVTGNKIQIQAASTLINNFLQEAQPVMASTSKEGCV